MLKMDSSYGDSSRASTKIPQPKSISYNNSNQTSHDIMINQNNNFTNRIQDIYNENTDNLLADNKTKNSQRAINVLVVEDDLTSQKVMKHMLTDLGYTNIKIVGTGQLAINAITITKFDLIIVDISLPDMDGFNISKEIRKSADNNNIAIIAITAFNREEVEAKCYSSGINDIITKPIFIDELKSVLDTWSHS